MPKTSESLEEKARRLAREIGKDTDETPVSATVKRQIALTLEHIERVRDLHAKLRDSILYMQCYTETELIRMEDRTPKYSPNRFPEREKIQKRLFALDQERRKLASAEEEKLQVMQQRLLSLMDRHTVIQPAKNKHSKIHEKKFFSNSRIQKKNGRGKA